MTIQLDYDLSRGRFERALTLSRSDAVLPAEWIERARMIGQAPSKTYVVVLGTALLARATNHRLDPFTLRVENNPVGYSARNLCKEVLVPGAVAAGVHVGLTGREPLNNRPFISARRIAPDMDVPAKARPYLDQLCDSLTALTSLDEEQATAALAAFLRVRIEDGPRRAAPVVVGRTMGVPELTASVSRFISSNPENGKRGQALTAACLDLLFDRVKTTRVYDPSRRWPGDVVAVIKKRITVAVEVKQRPASATEILQFAARCAQMKVHRAIAAVLSPEQVPLHVDELREEAWRRHGVHLSILEDASDLVHAALTWSPRPLSKALAELPQLMASRLEEVEVSAEGLATWAALFRRND